MSDHLRPPADELFATEFADPNEMDRLLTWHDPTEDLEPLVSAPDAVIPEVNIEAVGTHIERKVSSHFASFLQGQQDFDARWAEEQKEKAIHQRLEETEKLLRCFGLSDYEMLTADLEQSDIVQLPRSSAQDSCPTGQKGVFFDPSSAASMAGALLGVARPLVQKAAKDVVQFATPTPASPGDRQPPRPRGFIDPDQPAYPRRRGSSARRAGAVAATAASLFTLVPAIMDAPETAPTEQTAKPLQVELVNTKMAYVVPEETTVAKLANELKMPVWKLLSSNPNFESADAVVAPGQMVGGTIRASQVTLPKPMDLDFAAAVYHVSPAAMESVNAVDDNRQITTELIVPGVQIVQVDPEQTLDLDAVAEHLGMKPWQAKGFVQLNEQTLQDQMLIPLYSVAEDQALKLFDPVSIAAVAEGSIPPGTSIPAPTGSPVDPTSTSGVPIQTSSTTLSPETTTTLAPAPVAPEVAPVVPASEVLPAAAPAPEIKKPATPEEKLFIDKAAFYAALDHAYKTGGDLGPLNHVVAHSPMFKPYQLPAHLQDSELRALPPPEVLGLKFELHPDTMDKQLVAVDKLISTVLYTIYVWQMEAPKYGLDDSCVRVGDLTGELRHDSHDMDEVDMTSVMHCDIVNGHASADGPAFWHNKENGTINHDITNPNYNREFEKSIIGRMVIANIDGVPTVRRVLYNSPNLDITNVIYFNNHNHHIHVSATNNRVNEALRKWAVGGYPPNSRIGHIMQGIYLSYLGGEGVPGISKFEGEVPAVPQAPEATITAAGKSPEQMTDGEYIQWLADQVNPSLEDYMGFQIDTSRLGAFDSELSGRRIKPKKFVGHWTGGLYKNGVDQFIGAIKGREGDCCNVTYFTDQMGKVFQLVADPTMETSHAFKAGSYTQGNEIEAGGLRDYNPAQMRSHVILALRFMKEHNIPITRENFTGHQEIDVIIGRNSKPDFPTALVDALFPKLKALADVVAAEQWKQAQPNAAPTPVAPVVPIAPPEKTVEQQLLELAANPTAGLRHRFAVTLLHNEIALKEGSWTSFNHGDAGDAKGEYTFKDGRHITDMTLNEIKARQTLPKGHPDRLYAVGKFQFIPGTFANIMNAMKLDGNMKFDQAMQENMVTHFIFSMKAVAAYIRGDESQLYKAADQLCGAWISLPCSDGQGSHGESKNTGGKERLQRIILILNAVRTTYAEAQSEIDAANALKPAA